jgi:hypothetical protein
VSRRNDLFLCLPYGVRPTFKKVRNREDALAPAAAGRDGCATQICYATNRQPFVARFSGSARANLVRRAEPAEPDEQFRVYLDPDVDHHRPRRDEPPGWHRTRFLPAPTESDGRSPRCFHCRNFARPRFKLVGRI